MVQSWKITACIAVRFGITIRAMRSSVLDDLLKDLRKRQQDNRTMAPQGLMPKNEPAIIDTVLKLASEFEKLEEWVRKLDNKVAGSKR
jgi:hypothetical protein